MKINEAIIVEGQYDKISLSAIVDAVIVPVNGFSIFTDYDLLRYIQLLAVKTGIIILTDSDRAGFLIRNFLKNYIKEGRVLHAYIPDIRGKEKRKSAASKEGFLGVEGQKPDILLEALMNAGITENIKKIKEITKSDFYIDGLCGGLESREKRKRLAEYLSLPKRISTNALLDALNTICTYDEYKKIMEEINLISGVKMR